MVPSTLGFTDEDRWNLRSRAGSFFNSLRGYSSSVVGTNKPQLTAGQHRLEHVAGIRPFSCAGANDSVDLINESDSTAVRFFDLIIPFSCALQPRYLLPATIELIKGVLPVLPRRDVTGLLGRSTTAVFLYPGSG